METIKFHKYQGTGNDFILIDNRDLHFDAQNIELVSELCNRRFGIGADGLILIQEHKSLDFEMIYFNSDGSQSLCGNGSRCAMHFAKSLKMIADKATFLAYDGEHQGFFKNDLVYIKMKDVEGIDKVNDDHFVNTGSPHYVRFVEDIKVIHVLNEGKAVRYSESYKKEGTNVNFAMLRGENTISVRTYERGVEDETLSCGTGVTAVSIVATKLGLTSPITVHVEGGQLQVSFEQENNGFRNIYLIGPAVMVFEGSINISA